MAHAALLLASLTGPWLLGNSGAAGQVDGDVSLPCTSARQATNFTTYWLGPTFEGLHVSSAQLECHLKGSTLTYIYGECTAQDCSPTLQIQNWPSHMRNAEMYEPAPGTPEEIPQIRGTEEIVDGVPAASYQGVFEVYHPDTTVAIFGDAAGKRYVAGSLVKAPAVPARLEGTSIAFDGDCLHDTDGCQADRGDLGGTVLLLAFLLATLAPFFAALIRGRTWAFLIPVVGWPVAFFGAYTGWWGSGIGEFWQGILVMWVSGSVLLVAIGIAFRRVFADSTGGATGSVS